MVYAEETIIYPAILALSACLCQEIQDSGLPEPCACGPIIGDLVYDYCSGDSCGHGKCGQAWVRFVDAFPSNEFPSPSQTALNCQSPLAYSIEVGIVRCKPMGTNSNVSGYTPPTMQQNIDALSLQLADLAALRRAISCCFADSDTTYIMGSYTQAPPDADCLGGYFNITIWSA